MVANIFSASNDLIVLVIALIFIGVPITVLIIAVRAIVRRHQTWQEVKDQSQP